MKTKLLSICTVCVFSAGAVWAQETQQSPAMQEADTATMQMEEEMAPMENQMEETSDEASATGMQDIVALAASNDDLSTLVTAVKAAGLAETLQGDGPFTVFAPTNEAFEALPEGLLDELLKPENKEKLVKVLTYHVIPSEVMSSQLKDGMTSASVEGEDVKFMKQGDSFTVEGAEIEKADIDASNGVVHVISQVILPPDMKDMAKNKE